MSSEFKVGDLVITDGFWKDGYCGKIGIVYKMKRLKDNYIVEFVEGKASVWWWYWIAFGDGYRDKCKNHYSRIKKLS